MIDKFDEAQTFLETLVRNHIISTKLVDKLITFDSAGRKILNDYLEELMAGFELDPGNELLKTKIANMERWLIYFDTRLSENKPKDIDGIILE